MNEESKKYIRDFIIGWIIILIISILLGCSGGKSIQCCTYKDMYKRHWMNKKYGTNNYYGDLTSKWHKKKN